jgi:hypothetical protein
MRQMRWTLREPGGWLIDITKYRAENWAYSVWHPQTPTHQLDLGCQNWPPSRGFPTREDAERAARRGLADLKAQGR